MGTERIICDTDVMIDYWDIQNPRHSQTLDILENAIFIENIVLAAITKMELILGATNKKDLNAINKHLLNYNVSMINDSITEVAISLIQKYSLSHGLVLPDSLVASTAIVTNLKLFTYNKRDFVFIEGLRLYQP